MKPQARSPATTFGAGQSLAGLLSARAVHYPSKAFFHWEPFDAFPETWTYARFEAETALAAGGLRQRGIGRGDAVLIHLDNCPEFLLAWFACARIGAIAVSTNTRSSADEVRYFAGHCGARVAITQPSLASIVEVAMLTQGDVFIVGDIRADRAFSALMKQDSALFDPAQALEPLSIQYTSGTTGRPKAVVWTNANALWAGKVNATHEGLSERDVSLVFAPLFHTNAQAYSVLATLWAGATFVLQPRFSSSRFWEVSIRHRCTFSSQLYFTLRALGNMDAPKVHYYRLWGTGVCEHPIARDRFGIRTIGWWGMTETISHPIVGDAFDQNLSGTIGRAAPEYEVAVLNEHGQPCDPGETGDLLVRGIPGVSLFSGYLHDEKATEEAFDDAGWFLTGDRIVIATGGAMIFADRAKDMMKVGAENVAASEVERVVLSVPGVREVAVVGRPHPMLDEVPVAFVVASGSTDPRAEILRICREKLADFKVPKDVYLVDDLPRATLGKVAKNQLRELLRQQGTSVQSQ